MLIYSQLSPQEHTSVKFESKYKTFHQNKCISTCHLQIVSHFGLVCMCWNDPLQGCLHLAPESNELTHWGRVTHICVSKLTIIGPDNGLSPDRRQAIIWTNAGILLIGPLGTNFSEILIEILTFSFKKMCLKVSSAKRRPFCLGLNELTQLPWTEWQPFCRHFQMHFHESKILYFDLNFTKVCS